MLIGGTGILDAGTWGALGVSPRDFHRAHAISNAFGGSGGSNTTASYYFSTGADIAALSVTLAWNIDIEGGNGPNFSDSATLHNLDLYLYDVTGGGQVLVQNSVSTIDNTENLWENLQGILTTLKCFFNQSCMKQKINKPHEWICRVFCFAGLFCGSAWVSIS